MPRYIIRHRSRPDDPPSRPLARRVHVAARQAQTAELRAAALRDVGRLETALSEARRAARPLGERVHVCGYGRSTGIAVAEMSPRAVAALRAHDPDLEVLEDVPIQLMGPDAVAPVEAGTLGWDPWHLDAIGLTAARAAGFDGDGRGVTVAVLDAGVEACHPELRGKVLGAYAFDVDLWRWSEQRASVDTGGHGTHAAGLICGDNVGVAPGARIMSGIVLPAGYGRASDLLLAVEWVASRPEISIVILSARVDAHDPILREAVETLVAAGVFPLLASDGGQLGGKRSRGQPRALGPSMASEVGVTSCVMGGRYETWRGPAAAVPVLAGLAALLVEKYPRITVDELEEALPHACDELRRPSIGQGRRRTRGAAAV